MPDKAIDLIDEAASLIRMEIDSKPEDMDRLERRLIQLKIEREALKNDINPSTGKPVFNLAVALSLLVFFVFALQCTSTIVIMAKETGSWKWPVFAFSYMLGLAYLASFTTYRIASVFVP